MKLTRTSPTGLPKTTPLGVPESPPKAPRPSELPNAPVVGGAKTKVGTPEPLAELPPLPLTEPSWDKLPAAEGVLQGMWGQLVDALSGSASTREINRARKLVTEVAKHAERLAGLTEAELKAETPRLKAEVQDETKAERAAVSAAEKTLAKATAEARPEAVKALDEARKTLFKAEKKVLDRLLPEAFAAVREAARRASGVFHYDVQAMAGALMHHGLIAEMYTGEGKTLAATMPAYLGALAGHGFHVVTVNDYLARRDAEEMGRIYGYLGMRVGVLESNNRQSVLEPAASAKEPPKSREATRKEAYEADITYGTASEFGFDHLRDQGVFDPKERVQRPLYGVLLDEIDSLLIDEARTPLIIAEGGPKPDLARLEKYRDLVAQLDYEKGEVVWDMDEHWVSLTEKGQEKIEKALGTDNMYDGKWIDDQPFLTNALIARFLMRGEESYTVIDGEVRTVGHSGHAYLGRRFIGGLHQAIECKEGVEVQPENVTRASITMRDYLGKYARASGMTGTAVSAKRVFREVYGLDVARVPTRKKLIRIDHPDKVFETIDGKLKAFLADLEEAHKTGRPILVGCEFTANAEALGKLCAERGLDVRVLGAKSDAEEADIVAQAGKKGAITIATTRGGRGVDIKLGGDPRLVAADLKASEGLDDAEARKRAGELCGKAKAEILELGGLLVMSWEHLDSRRRDDQLRGRAGRQGDPGATIFYSSLEDPVYDGLADATKVREGKKDYDEAKHRKLTEAALDHSEARVNGVLSESLPYDNVNASQREHFYAERRHLLEIEDVRPIVRTALERAFDKAFEGLPKDHEKLNAEQADQLLRRLWRMLPLSELDEPPEGAQPLPAGWVDDKTVGEIRTQIGELVDKLLAARDEKVGESWARHLERMSFLGAMDEAWNLYLDESMALREGIGWRAMAQKDPKLEYSIESSKLYNATLDEVRGLLAMRLLKYEPPPPLGGVKLEGGDRPS